ncbi:hypothetical protein LTR49_017595 [Elasticomyces elasticus]|nr:hypothetical protein LTR49_017595 [Elasticomyces elasticus]KAK5734639.1 hypothetical protein LTS12_026654 [Elasticomyces elasticus]
MSESRGEFIQCIRASSSILVVVGAGISRPSGLPTFREDPEFWGRPIEQIASKKAFDENPEIVWDLYERLRIMATNASPNEGHLALARLSKAKPGCLMVTQNIDEELSARAGHGAGTLQALHGSLFDIKCASDDCAFRGRNVSEQVSGLTWCPACKTTYLRPGVVWFNERLPSGVVERIEAWLESHDCIDMVLVIGTDRTPYAHEALAKGAKMAWFNIMEDELESTGDADWVVDGDASWTLPNIIDEALASKQSRVP